MVTFPVGELFVAEFSVSGDSYVDEFFVGEFTVG